MEMTKWLMSLPMLTASRVPKSIWTSYCRFARQLLSMTSTFLKMSARDAVMCAVRDCKELTRLKCEAMVDW